MEDMPLSHSTATCLHFKESLRPPCPPSPFLLLRLAADPSDPTACCPSPVSPVSHLAIASSSHSDGSLEEGTGSISSRRAEHAAQLEEALAHLRTAENRVHNLEFHNAELQSRLQSAKSQLPAQELAYQQLQERFLCMQSRWHQEQGSARLQVQELQARLAAAEAARAASEAALAAANAVLSVGQLGP